MRKRLTVSSLLVAITVAASAAEQSAAWITPTGSLALEPLGITLAPVAYSPSWQHTRVKPGFDIPESGKPVPFVLEVPEDGGGGLIRGTATFTPVSQNAVKCHYEFTPERDVKLQKLAVNAVIPEKLLIGRRWQADVTAGSFPEKLGPQTLFSGNTGNLKLPFDAGALKFTMPNGMETLLQDSRQWSRNFLFRVGPAGPLQIKAGETRVVEFTLFTAGPLTVRPQEPLTLTAGEDWKPLQVELDILPGSALDFSTQGWHDAPAGKHGRVIVKGSHFEFENLPGKRQRFYGVNLSNGANVPSIEVAEQVAERLMRLGYNTVRIHHYERELIKGSADSVTLNPEAMARFDYFMAELIKRGMYLSTDLFVSRSVPWKEISEDKPGLVPARELKGLFYVHPGARENLKTFVRNFLSHVNPHTGRSYAEEPALAWINLVNEGNFLNAPNLLKQPLWVAAWEKWITRKRAADPAFADIPDALPPDFKKGGRHTAAYQVFLAETEIEFAREWTAFLRDELHCRALVSNQNGWWPHSLIDHAPRAASYDYVDDHFYVEHPKFPKGGWSVPSLLENAHPFADKMFTGDIFTFVRNLDKPFTISEWNHPAPGRYRALSALRTGALAAQQDWSGLWRFGYLHSANMSVPLQLGYFDMLCDPLNQASERAVLTLFMRGDIEPHPYTTAINFTRAELSRPRETPFPFPALYGWGDIIQKTKVGFRMDAPGVVPANETDISFEDAYAGKKPVLPKLTEPAARLNYPACGQMTIDTPHTAGGFTENGALQAGPLHFDVGDVPAAVWVNSLDKQPISQSKRLLLTHLTDLQNSGTKYLDRTCTTLIAWGKLPHIVRIGKAQITLKIDSPESYTVYALATSGRRIGKVAAAIGNGSLSFTADTAHPETAVMSYELVIESTN